MNVLITGAGIIGCQIASALVSRGDDVTLFDLKPVEKSIRSVTDARRLRVVAGDVTDYGALERAVADCDADACIHTASLLTLAAKEDPRNAVSVNILGSVNVLELARRAPLRRVVIASSATVAYSILGTFSGDFIPDDFAMKVLSERPSSFYAASKLSVEFFAQLYRDTLGVDAVVLRYPAVLGAWAGPNVGLISRLVASVVEPAVKGVPAVLDDGLLMWEGLEEFIDARDVARATVAALDAGTLPNGVYSIAAPKACTYDDFLAAARHAFPNLEIDVKKQPRGGLAGSPHSRQCRFDGSAAERDLGFHAAIPLEESLKHFGERMKAELGLGSA